jgi:D-alanyl-lipoteichoic acid acyltransferase DltB (MBOAT superfamily)
VNAFVEPAERGALRAWAARELAFGRLAALGAVAFQVALLVGAIRVFNLETNALEKVATLVLATFLVHHFLPTAWRLPAFALLSVTSILLLFGWTTGGFLLGLGLLLIGLAHLPVPFVARVGLILAAAAAYAVLRVSPAWLPPALRNLVPGAIWPILGSMFMFRLMVYLYDLKHRTAPAGIWNALAYFFMVPNACFPLFPVVDYQTFCRNRYNDDPLTIYQLGTKWILRGVIQLLLYRFVYLHGVIAVENIHDGLGVARYMLATFLLYLKISGTFHLIVGMLHLFGFNLPETHHLYLLSSSFTDFWRRINIYWKDFITKIVFYPLFFRWRKKR